MLKILLLSDTHSFIDEAVLKHVAWADEVWHVGDFGNIEIAHKIQKIKPLVGVYGNIDGTEIRSEFPKEIFFERGGMSIYMTHIGGYPNKYASGILDKIKTLQPQVFICGHSHILKVIFDKKYNLLHLNPGAIGKYGMQKTRTMLRFEIANGTIQNMEVIEYPL
ncbi:MAG: metallophosphoesterase family protein [Capnocytophaga sp.]|nr:metallophosphoesterase family protein [Capnocytophaga sp.]